jgi:hypothetical protein
MAKGDRVSFGGETVDRRTRDMLREAQRIANAEDPSIGDLRLSQGSFSHSVGASAGTHGGPGAFDLSIRGYSEHQKDVICLALRKVGFASWRRYPSQGPWPEHVHGIAIGTKGLPPIAESQVRSYLDGRDGLRGNRRDTQDRPDNVLTWEQYKAKHLDGDGGGGPAAGEETRPESAGAATDPYGIDAGQGVSSVQDSDADGLTDEFEKLARTDPLRADTDGDGVSDGHQLLTSRGRLGTGMVLDSDHDGIADWLELAAQPGTGSAVGAGIGPPTQTAQPPGRTAIDDGSAGELLGN